MPVLLQEALVVVGVPIERVVGSLFLEIVAYLS